MFTKTGEGAGVEQMIVLPLPESTSEVYVCFLGSGPDFFVSLGWVGEEWLEGSESEREKGVVGILG